MLEWTEGQFYKHTTSPQGGKIWIVWNIKDKEWIVQDDTGTKIDSFTDGELAKEFVEKMWRAK